VFEWRKRSIMVAHVGTGGPGDYNIEHLRDNSVNLCRDWLVRNNTGAFWVRNEPTQ